MLKVVPQTSESLGSDVIAASFKIWRHVMWRVMWPSCASQEQSSKPCRMHATPYVIRRCTLSYQPNMKMAQPKGYYQHGECWKFAHYAYHETLRCSSTQCLDELCQYRKEHTSSSRAGGRTHNQRTFEREPDNRVVPICRATLYYNV